MMKSKGIWQPLVLATVLGAGFAVPWGALIGLLQLPVAGPDRADWEQLLFRRDGTPVIRTAYGFHDLAGREIEADDRDPWIYGVYLGAGDKHPVYSFPATWDQRLRGFVDTGRPPGFWYFVWDGKPHGSAYLVGYHSKTNARLGFIGTGGLRADEPPPEERFPFGGREGLNTWQAGIYGHLHSPQGPFALSQYPLGLPRVNQPPKAFPPWGIYLQGNDDRIYQIDLSRRSAAVALEVPALRSTALGGVLPVSATDGIPSLAARTEDAVILMNNRNEVLRKFPLPAELREQDFVWDVTVTGTPLAWTTRTDKWETGSTEYQVYWLDAAGHVTRRQEITLRGQSSAHMRYFAGMFVPAPVILGPLVGAIMPLEFIAYGESATMPEACALALDRLWPSLLLAFVAGGWLSWRCYLRQVRYGAGRGERIVWPIFVFAFGLFGWIGYRCHRSWPALAPCPTCNAFVPRDRVECAACRAQFPLPALKGTEVFA